MVREKTKTKVYKKKINSIESRMGVRQGVKVSPY